MLGRKTHRIVDGARVALATVCVECGADKVYGLDRCHAHYMVEYRKRRRSAPVPEPESPKPHRHVKDAPAVGESLKPESPKRRKPYPKAESDFESTSKARAVALHLRNL